MRGIFGSRTVTGNTSLASAAAVGRQDALSIACEQGAGGTARRSALLPLPSLPFQFRSEMPWRGFVQM